MQKTPFAGLTELEPGESIATDGGAFTKRDREIIDRLVEIGAKTHRHSGAAGLTNPAGAASGTVVPSGGTLEADRTFVVGYTLQDNQRGETMISPVATVSSPGPLTTPLVAPTLAADYTAGSLVTDTYYYGVTYVDGEGGETPLGPVANITRDPGYANARILLSGLASGLPLASATGWRLYRMRGGGDFAYLASGSSNSYTDDGTVSPICDTHPPPDNLNTTNSINTLMVDLPSNPQIAAASYINLYISDSGSFNGATFIEQFPVSSAGQRVLYQSLQPLDQQPPNANLSIGGANQIDPDTELLDWHWKRPVGSASNLPSGALGDVRLATQEGNMYLMLQSPSGTSAQWTAFRPGGASGASATGPGRRWGSATINLGSGASGNVDFAGGAAGVELLKISTSKRTRVRVYGDTTSRAADVGRAGANDPTGDHGVYLDYAATVQASGMTGRVVPPVFAHNLDDPPSNKQYMNVMNYDAAGNVVVAFLYIPKEVV